MPICALNTRLKCDGLRPRGRASAVRSPLAGSSERSLATCSTAGGSRRLRPRRRCRRTRATPAAAGRRAPRCTGPRAHLVEVAEEGAEPTRLPERQTARKVTAWIRDEQGCGVGRRRRPYHERWPEHRPPQDMVGGLIEQHVVLTREQPGQRPGGQLVPALAEDVRRRSRYDEVDLQLSVAVRSGPSFAPGGRGPPPPQEKITTRELTR